MSESIARVGGEGETIKTSHCSGHSKTRAGKTWQIKTNDKDHGTIKNCKSTQQNKAESGERGKLDTCDEHGKNMTQTIVRARGKHGTIKRY